MKIPTMDTVETAIAVLPLPRGRMALVLFLAGGALRSN